MAAKIFAVVDTNVLVSALLARHSDSAPVLVFEHLLDQDIIPLYNEEIISEYGEVLRRAKFHFDEEAVQNVISTLVRLGRSVERVKSSELFPDPKDIVFYEIALSREGSYLVTGNTKHFPKKPIVVTPAQIIEIINNLQAD